MTSQPTRSAEHCSAAFSRQTGDPAQEAVERGTHFLENHDEPRIASRLSIEEHRAAALLILGLPGLALLHEGQLTGATIHASVHLRRRPSESPQPELASFYEHLLFTLQRTAVGRGRSELLKPCPAWEGNPTAQNFVVVQWQSGPSEFDLVVVNLAPHQSQCYVRLSIANLAERNWTMTNLLGTECLERHGAPLRERSLYLNLPAHGAQLFHFS